MNFWVQWVVGFWKLLLTIIHQPTVVPQGQIKVLKKREVADMPEKLGYTLSLQAPGASDVLERRLYVTLNGGTPEPHFLAPTATQYEILVDDGDQVHVELIDVDRKGNASEPAIFEFKAIDDIPPPKPGELHVVSKREVEEPEPPPAPPAPEPTPEPPPAPPAPEPTPEPPPAPPAEPTPPV